MFNKVRCMAALNLILFLGFAINGFCADPKEILENTVKKYYDAFLQSKWKAAEQYVDPESRDYFRSQTKSSILKYEIKGIEFLKGGQEASVTVAVEQPIALLGGSVLTANYELRWKLMRGKWYFVIGALPPRSPLPTNQIGSSRDEITKDLRFDYTDFDIGTKRQGDIVEIDFPFVNATDHPVHVAASLINVCKCVEVGVSKETIAPGEKALVHFTLHSDPITFNYHQGVGIQVEPGGGKAILDIVGFFAPAADNPLPVVVKSSGGEK